MDNIPQFDLDKTVHDWRETLADSAAFRSSDVDELECHLRDSTKALQAIGLSCSEAFCLAKFRLGTGDALSQEFEKMNAGRVWINRVLWMVVGWLAIGAAYNLALRLVNLATFLAFLFIPDNLTNSSQILGAVSLLMNVAVLVSFCFLLWRSGKRKNSIVWRFGGWMKVHPVAAGLIAFLLLTFNTVGSYGATVLMAKTMPIQIISSLMMWGSFGGLLPAFLCPVALVSLLILTGRQRVAQ